MRCTQCSREFEAKRSDSIYCSAKCRVNKARGIIRNTEVKLSVTDTDVTDNVTDNVENCVTDKHTLVEMEEDRIPIRRNGVITDEFVTVHPDGKHCKQHCIGKLDHCSFCKK